MKCERCGKEYRIRTISENHGKHFCRDCTKICLVCGKKLPMSNWFGQDASITGAFLASIPATAGIGVLHELRRPWIGSGMCNECFWKQERLTVQSKLVI
jgi:hypothetical protein